MPIWIPLLVIAGAIVARAIIVAHGGIGNAQSLTLYSDVSQTYRQPDIRGPTKLIVDFRSGLIPTPGGQFLAPHVTPTSVTVNGAVIDLFNAYDGAHLTLDLPTQSGTVIVQYTKYAILGAVPFASPTATIIYGP